MIQTRKGRERVQTDLDWVTKRVAVGGCISNARDMAEVARQGVTGILNMDGCYDDCKLAARHRIRTYWNHVPDDFLPKDSTVFQRGVDFAKVVLSHKDGKLLVHCHAGIHRAPMMALAVLGAMGWDLDAAELHITRCRPQADFPLVYIESVQRYLQGARRRP
jgi:protein-tyrosine phosphatase